MTSHKWQCGGEMTGGLERQECIKTFEGLDIEGEKKRKFKDVYWFSHLCRTVHGVVSPEMKGMEEDQIEGREERNYEYKILLYFFLCLIFYNLIILIKYNIKFPILIIFRCLLQ